MTRNLLLLGAFAMSAVYGNAQFGLAGEIFRGTSNAIEKKKEDNNKRRGDAPQLAQMPQAADASLEMTIPSGESGFVKPEITTTFNQEHAGEIVFSKTMIPKGISSAGKLTNTFNLGDAIEMRFFMETNICNYYLYIPGNNTPVKNSKAYYTTLIYIDGDLLHPVFMGDKYMDKDMRNVCTFRNAIFGTGDQKVFNNSFVVDKLNNLSSGTHSIKVELWAGDIEEANSPRSLKPISIGEFTLTKKEGQKLHKGKTMSDVPVGMSDPELEAEALKAINTYARSQGWKEKFTELVIIESEWSTIRNELTGVILGRTIDVYVKGVWPDGHCTGVVFGISQEFNGSGYSKGCGYYGIGTTEKLECD
jgi:hypothetical protein